MDFFQEHDSASIVQSVDIIYDRESHRRWQDDLNGYVEIEELKAQKQESAPLVPPQRPQLDLTYYLPDDPQPQTQTQTQVLHQTVDMAQFQLIDDRPEDIEIPQDVPRITEEMLDNRFGGGNEGGKKRTDYHDRYLLRMVANAFLKDPFVIAFGLPQLQKQGYSKDIIKQELLLLTKRPLTKNDLFYLILDPRIRDPFKKAFASFYAEFIDDYLTIAAEKSKIKKLSTFLKYHRRITAYLSRLRTQTVSNRHAETY